MRKSFSTFAKQSFLIFFSLGLLHWYLCHLNSLHLANIYKLYGVRCLIISYAEE